MLSGVVETGRCVLSVSVQLTVNQGASGGRCSPTTTVGCGSTRLSGDIACIMSPVILVEGITSSYQSYSFRFSASTTICRTEPR